MRLYLNIALVILKWCLMRMFLYMVILIMVMIYIWLSCILVILYEDCFHLWACVWSLLLKHVDMYSRWYPMTSWTLVMVLFYFTWCVRLWGPSKSLHLFTLWMFMNNGLIFLCYNKLLSMLVDIITSW